MFGFLHEYPYTDFHELNLDFLLRLIIEQNEKIKNFINLETIKYANPILWDITTQYEKNTVVIDPETGTAYISVKPVPSGVLLSNTDYWTVIFTLDIVSANQNLTSHDAGNNVLSTFTSAVGDWLLWRGVLYVVTQDIGLNTAYVPGFNIEKRPVEEFIAGYLDLIYDQFDSVDNNINIINSSIMAVNSSIMAINSELLTIHNDINDINDKLAVHTVYNVKSYGAKGDGTTDDTAAIKAAFSAANTTGGRIYFPYGNYRITEPLTIDHYGVSITGENQQRVYLYIDHDMDNAIRMGKTDGTMTTSFEVSHLSIICRSDTPSTHTGLYFVNGVNCRIDDIIVTNFRTGIRWSKVGNSFMTRTAVMSDVSGAVGFNVGNGSVSSGMTNCYAGFTGSAVDNGQGLYMAEGNVADFCVDYFDVGNGARGIYIDGSNSPEDRPPADIRLTNIVCDGARLGGIRIANLAGEGNVVINGGWLNIARQFVPCIDLYHVNNILITNMVMQQLLRAAPTQVGISIDVGTNVQILDNKFINMKTALNVATADCLMVDNNIISLYSGQTLSSNYHIYGTGIYNSFFRGNLIRMASLGDIYIASGSGIIISENKVTTAITVDASVTTVINKDNIIAGSVQT